MLSREELTVSRTTVEQVERWTVRRNQFTPRPRPIGGDVSIRITGCSRHKAAVVSRKASRPASAPDPVPPTARRVSPRQPFGGDTALGHLPRIPIASLCFPVSRRLDSAVNGDLVAGITRAYYPVGRSRTRPSSQAPPGTRLSGHPAPPPGREARSHVRAC